MNTGTFYRWLKFHSIDAQILDNEKAEREIKKLVSVVSGSRLHDLWESVDSKKFMIKSRISDDQEIYRDHLDYVLDDGRFTLIIDDVCFTDATEPIAISFEKDVLLNVLSDFNLYLDEIYITDSSAEWFICINHHLELFLFGDPSERKCIAIKERIEEFEEKDSNEEEEQEEEE